MLKFKGSRFISIILSFVATVNLFGPISAFAENEQKSSPTPTHATVIGATYLYHPNFSTKLQSGVSVTKIQKLSAEGKYVDVTSDMPYNLTKSDKNGKYALYFSEEGSYKISFRYRQGASLIYRYDLQLEVKLGFEHSVDIPLQTAPKANDTKGRRLETSNLMPAFAEKGDDMVFMLICGARDMIYGLFINEKGELKKFEYEFKDVAFEIRASNGKSDNYVKENYDMLLSIAVDTGERINQAELNKYIDTLAKFDKNGSLTTHLDFSEGAPSVPAIQVGFHCDYGIRRTPQNELEVILLRDYGDSYLKNQDPNTDTILEWLLSIFKLPKGTYSELNEFGGLNDVYYYEFLEAYGK
ncbi:MAG: hypothetical protein FWG90_04355 [Oscillospiraceae bacterium]|nr:hypothetical protein [Oscillospiraceae bacterium]